jgi:hypothetical protein
MKYGSHAYCGKGKTHKNHAKRNIVPKVASQYRKRILPAATPELYNRAKRRNAERQSR